MTPAARLQATLDLLQEIDASNRAADGHVSAYFRARRFIGSKDRAAISACFYAVLRHYYRLGWWLEKQAAADCPRSRLLAWLALGEATGLPQLEVLFSGGQYAPRGLTEEERRWLKRLQGSVIEHPAMPEIVIAECPPDLEMPLRQKFGGDFMREMRAMQAPAPLDLRVNTLKAARKDIMDELAQQGLRPAAGDLTPWSVRLFDRPSLGNLSMLKAGRVEIQDEGSQLVAKAVGARPGDRVADFCAGAGGKSLAMGAMMENKGRITALDISESRLKKSTERFRRAGLHNIETHVLAGTGDPWIKKHKGSFDCLLADAPCGGSGTWRRNPDARWRELGPGLDNLVGLQAAILASAARLVRPGGRLVYSTCSLLPAENEAQVAAFLAAHPDFSVVPCGLDGASYLALSPARHGCDGFFAAAMVKAAAAVSPALPEAAD